MPAKRREPFDAEMVLFGAVILRRYRHPESWERARSPRPAGMTLQVEELRIGDPEPGMPANAPDQARANADAIRAFASHMGLKIQIDQQPGKAPRIYISAVDWPDALLVLKALSSV